MQRKVSGPVTLLLSAVLPLLGEGCASVLHGTHQNVRIVTIPPGATAEALGQATTTPGVLKLPRGHKHVTIHIEKDGFKPADVTLHHKLSGAVWANFALIPVGVGAGYQVGDKNAFIAPKEAGYGAISFPPLGMLIDFANGAAFRFRSVLTVSLEAATAVDARNGRALGGLPTSPPDRDRKAP